MSTTQLPQTEAPDCYSTNGEDFKDGEKADALQELYDDDRLEVGSEYRLGVSKRPDPTEFFDLQKLIEDMQEEAYGLGGDFAEDYLTDVPDAKFEELDAMVKAWLRENVSVRFFTVMSIQTLTVTQKDIDDFDRNESTQQGEGGEA